MQPKLADDFSDFPPFVPYTSVDNGHWLLKIERNGPKMSNFTVSYFFIPVKDFTPWVYALYRVNKRVLTRKIGQFRVTLRDITP
jgi:hypothetical protein